MIIINNHPLGFSETSNIVITKDKGANWKRIDVPFEINGAEIKFHPTNADMVLATDQTDGKLHISHDFCETWKAVHTTGKTHAYKWDPLGEYI